MNKQGFIKECTLRNFVVRDYGDRLFAFRVVTFPWPGQPDRIVENMQLAGTFNPTRTPPEDFGGKDGNGNIAY
jgi:hypothetical protein